MRFFLPAEGGLPAHFGVSVSAFFRVTDRVVSLTAGGLAKVAVCACPKKNHGELQNSVFEERTQTDGRPWIVSSFPIAYYRDWLSPTVVGADENEAIARHNKKGNRSQGKRGSSLAVRLRGPGEPWFTLLVFGRLQAVQAKVSWTWRLRAAMAMRQSGLEIQGVKPCGRGCSWRS